jgi:hypothetical protein
MRTSENPPSRTLVNKRNEKGRLQRAGPGRGKSPATFGGGSPEKVSYRRGPPGSIIGAVPYPPLATSKRVVRY